MPSYKNRTVFYYPSSTIKGNQVIVRHLFNQQHKLQFASDIFLFRKSGSNHNNISSGGEIVLTARFPTRLQAAAAAFDTSATKA